MSLMRQTFHPTIARTLLAVVLVCALLVTQFGLSRHVVEHSATPVVAAITLDDPSKIPDGSGCLTCLEYQAHGNGLTGYFGIALINAAYNLERQAIPPNTPYLAPERASQRAPPVLS